MAGFRNRAVYRIRRRRDDGPEPTYKWYEKAPSPLAGDYKSIEL
jgi:hypothetical protein